MKYAIDVEYLHSGMSDYWGGDSRRYDDMAGCLFAPYTHKTTLPEIIEALCDDYTIGGDCESFPPEIDEDDIRQALLDSLTDEGKRMYEADEVCEWATSYGLSNGLGDEDEDEDEELPCLIVLVTVRDTEDE